ncbi:uncharacterized protein DS421_13g425360 [Arachis hypogaea]|nr:uncharacterized protein DS421_13g425360 [Arachis hypogaea]
MAKKSVSYTFAILIIGTMVTYSTIAEFPGNVVVGPWKTESECREQCWMSHAHNETKLKECNKKCCTFQCRRRYSYSRSRMLTCFSVCYLEHA